MPKKYNVDASNTLAFTSDATENISEALGVSSPLTIASTATLNHLIKTVSDTLTLSDNVTRNIITYTEADNVLSLQESINVIRAYYVSAIDNLIISENLYQTIRSGTASNILIISDTVDVSKPINISVEHNLTTPWDEVTLEELMATDLNDPVAVAALFENRGLRQSVSIQITHNESVTSFLSFGDQAAASIVLNITQQLFLTDLAEAVLHDEVIDILVITHSVSYDVTGPVTSDLVINHTAINDGIYPRSVSNTLNIQDVVSYLILDFCNYGLGVGAGADAPPAVAPTLVAGANVVFTYPYSTPVLTLPLRRPNFDNVTQLEYRKINRRSRGGTLQIFRDTAWPSAERLILTFSALKQEEITNLFTFLKASLGKEIGYLDHESRQWRGVILTPSAQMSEESREGFSASVEIEGVKV